MRGLGHADCFPNPSGLIGWWPGDGNANNLLGTNNGTLQGGATASAPGLVGNAFTFDGTNNFVQIPNSPILQPTNLTIEAWIKFTGLDSAGTGPAAGVQNIIFKQNKQSSSFEGFDLGKTRVSGSDYFRFIVSSASGQTATIRSSTIISTGIWYHVAAVRGPNFTQLYVNGILERQTNVSFAQSYGTQPLYFGTTGQSYWDRRFKGNLDEVSLYDRALDSNDIAAVYAAGAAGKCKAPAIIAPPQNQFAQPGTDVSFAVTASGFGLLSYQWQFNAVAIPGATNATLLLTNVQMSQAGYYSVIVSNALGVNISTEGLLSVGPECSALPFALTSWWRGEANVSDATGLNPGNTPYGIAYAPGKVGQAFDFDGSSRRVSVADSPNFKFTDGFTLEAWVYPRQYAGLILFRGDNRPGLDAWSLDAYQNGKVNFQIVDTSGNVANVLAPLALNQWQHVASTWDRVSHTLKLYLNGILAAQTDTFLLPSANLDPGSEPAVGIGNHGGTVHQFPFNGLIDEPAIYSHALDANEIQAIYASDSTGKCLSPTAPHFYSAPLNQSLEQGTTIVLSAAVGGTAPLSFQWFFNGTPLVNDARTTGATTPAVTLTDTQTNLNGSYSLVVTNAYGAITSAPVTLTIFIPPCAPAPDGISAWWRAETNAQDMLTASPGYLEGNTTYGPGRVGSAFVFDGNDDGVHLFVGDFVQYQDFSMEGWIKRSSAGTASFQGNGDGVIFSVGTSAGGYELWLRASDGRLLLGRYQSVQTLTTASVTDTNWHHVAVTRNGTATIFYLDGVAYDAGPFNAGTFAQAVDGFIGCRRTSNNARDNSFYGAIDELTVYNRSLTPFEITAIRDAGLTGKCLDGAAPVIFRQPYAGTHDAGHNLSLDCLAGGLPKPSFQWFRNGSPLSESATVIGAQSNTLTLVNAQTNLTGDYFVAVSNSSGVVTSTVTALVITDSAPIIYPWLSPPAVQSRPPGSNILFTAAVAGSEPKTLQWFFNGIPLTNSTKITGATSTDLSISELTPNDTGFYTLTASNAFGSATTSNSFLFVGFPPTIQQAPASQTNLVGNSQFFAVMATGTEPLTYRWFLNSTPLTEDARHLGVTTANLTISNLIVGDAGNYTVQVANPAGNITSSVATLTIPPPPLISVQPRGYSIPVGMPVTLTTTASGTAPLRYQWLLNSNPVANATNNNLTLSNVVTENFGSYQLVVTNTGGAVTSAVAQLTRGTVAVWGNVGQVASFPIWPAAGLSNVIAVAAGQNYSLALRQDGSVYYWGNNSQASNLPPDLSGVVGVAAGPNHALAVLSNGLVRAWGLGTSGQTNIPTTLSNVMAVAAGTTHSAALRSDGSVMVWGGTTTEAQTNVPAGLIKVTSIDAGGSQTLALREDGQLVAWGGRIQYPVPSDVKNVAQFSVGPAFGALDLALASNGLVRAWGGFGTATNVPANLSGITALEGAGGIDQSTGIALAVRSNRTVFGWGGSGSAASLTNVPAGVSNVVNLSGGTAHVLALEDDGAPLIVRPPIGGTFDSGRELVMRSTSIGHTPLSFQWFKNGNPIPGANAANLVFSPALLSHSGSYQLVVSNALGVAQSITVPVTLVDRAPALLTQPASRFAYYGSPLSVGASVIGSGPIAFTWLQNGVPTFFGTNDLVFERALPQHDGNYQLIVSNSLGAVTSSVAKITFSRIAVWGNGPSLSNAPVDLGTITDAASAYYHLLAIRPDGTVAAWGTPLNGATNVPPDLSNVVAVAGGKYFSVALRSDGTAVAWGLNNYGQTNVPASATNLSAISAGVEHVLGLRSNGTLVAWGNNANSRTDIPVGLNNVVAISAGHAHNVALKSDGTAVAWGLNAVNPPYLTNLIAIAANTNKSFGLHPDSTVISWMNGNQTPPTNLVNVVTLASGGAMLDTSGIIAHSFALLSNGTVVGWGNNFANQLNHPPELTSVVKLSCGYTHTLAVLNDRAPAVTVQPIGKHVVSGGSAELTALAVGEPTLHFQWRLNGNEIPGATNPTLTLTNVTRAARGYYSALVWNALGSITSREAWLDVVGPVRLQNATGSENGTVTFTALDNLGSPLTAEDLAWLTVQASTNLVNWQSIPNALFFTNSTLLLRDPNQTNYPARYYRLIEQ